MSATQTFKNHSRYDPLFHFISVPLAIFTFAGAIHLTVHDWPRHNGDHILLILMSLTSFLIAGVARSSALRAQNRTIRLEERLRYAALLSPGDLATSASLTLRQVIALRFASDAELPALIKRSLSENLTSKQIKQNITTWRPDYDRV